MDIALTRMWEDDQLWNDLGPIRQLRPFLEGVLTAAGDMDPDLIQPQFEEIVNIPNLNGQDGSDAGSGSEITFLESP
jgi:hypothetical protein